MSINVSLDVTQNPAVTVDPEEKPKKKGKDTITWERAQGQNFDFVSLVIDGNPDCFSKLKVKAHKITIDDDNPGGQTVEYLYTIVVSLNGVHYNTHASIADGGDAIGMKEKSQDSVTTMQALVRSGPIIRNEPV